MDSGRIVVDGQWSLVIDGQWSLVTDGQAYYYADGNCHCPYWIDRKDCSTQTINFYTAISRI